MDAAVFGLIGVILGGLITAGTQWWRDTFVRRRERTVAARLVSSELGDALAAVKFAIENKAWWPNDLRRDDWDRYISVLTAELNMKEWLVVLTAHDSVETALRTREVSGGPLAMLPAAAVKDLETQKAKLEKAIDWLQAHSYNFEWWKLHRHIGLWGAKRGLHKDGPDVPT